MMFTSLALENLALLQRRTDPSSSRATFEELTSLSDAWGNVVGATRFRQTLETLRAG